MRSLSDELLTKAPVLEDDRVVLPRHNVVEFHRLLPFEDAKRVRANTLTIGWLPETLRNAYGLKHRTRTFRAALSFMWILVCITSRRLREWPSRHYLRRLEQHSPPPVE